VLRDPAIHKGKTYNLTGPEELTMAQAARILTAETGRTITYHPETVEEAYASRASYGAPPWQVDAWVSTYTAMAAGEMAGISPDIHGLTGQDPLSLSEVPEAAAAVAAPGFDGPRHVDAPSVDAPAGLA
jgi:NAD(P)H dehydrogenase (quinone)